MDNLHLRSIKRLVFYFSFTDFTLIDWKIISYILHSYDLYILVVLTLTFEHALECKHTEIKARWYKFLLISPWHNDTGTQTSSWHNREMSMSAYSVRG